MVRARKIVASLAVVLAAGGISGRVDALPIAAPETVLTTTDCVLEAADSNSPPSVKICGFQRIELNRAGDRLLTMTVEGTAQLWDRSGRELLKISTQPNFGTLGGAMIADDKLYVVSPDGTLIRFNLHDGKEVWRRAAPSDIQGIMQVYGTRYALALVRGSLLSKYGILDLETGTWKRQWDNLWPSWHGTGRIIGTHSVQIAPKNWQTRIILADDVLTEVPAPRWCRLELDERLCVSPDESGSGVTIMDVQTGVTKHDDLRLKMDDNARIEWFGTADWLWAARCNLRSAPGGRGSARDHCTVVDIKSKRRIFSFDTVSHKIAAARGPDGERELRVALSEDQVNPTYQVMRVTADGRATPVSPKSELIGLKSLFGDLLVGVPGEGGKLAIIGGDGLPGSRVPIRFAHCVPMNGCSASHDKSVVAITEPGPMREESDRGLDKVRWFETAQFQAARSTPLSP